MDASEALAMEGVVTYVSADDVPGSNLTADGEEVFVTEQVRMNPKWATPFQIYTPSVNNFGKCSKEGVWNFKCTYHLCDF